jgi:hypothetical protein
MDGRLVARDPIAKSTASFAMTRYVVSLPPAMTVRPGVGEATVCSRETLADDVPALVPGCRSGRRPAHVPMTSSRVIGRDSTSLACSMT